ncbi:MAG: hypothetical protein HY399_05770 [Elusimicrobia bacterium]|nr:hypothetical protein [Elusimicrobiota bacterium]
MNPHPLFWSFLLAASFNMPAQENQKQNTPHPPRLVQQQKSLDLFKKGLVQYEEGEYEASMSSMIQALLLDPTNAQIRYYVWTLGKILQEKESRRLPTRKERQEIVFKAKRLLSAGRKGSEGSHPLTENLTNPDPGHPSIGELAQRALNLSQAGDLENSLQAWEEVLRLDPNYSGAVDSIEKLKSRLLEQKRRASLEMTLTEVLSLYHENKLLEAAEKALDVIREDPFNPHAQELLAQIGNYLKERKESTGIQERAQQVYLEGLIEFSQGNPLEARRLWKKALRYDPNHLKSRKAIERVGMELQPLSP